ncbi:MAG: RNA polymerase sigma factor SigJ [Actinomycetota bacterium]
MSQPSPDLEPGSSPSSGPAAAALFEVERRHLLGVAYRLLGTLTDAEDVLQDVFERWLATDRSTVANPAAYLTTMTTRASIDRLRSARAHRELYVGPWLPEPVPSDDTERSPEALAELDESLTIGYLHLLEQLTPRERAAHLLHDVYDFSYREIAPMIDREEASCRQLASRARAKLRASRPDRDRTPSPEVERDLCHRLVDAVAGGDIALVMSLLTDDVVHISDGGAEHRAARQPVVGSDRVARLLVNLAARLPDTELDQVELRHLRVNHQAAVLVLVGDSPVVMLAIDVEAPTGHANTERTDRIDRIWAVVNPDKLAAVLDAVAVPNDDRADPGSGQT